MIAEQNYGAPIADVKMWLIVDGASFRTTYLGRDFLLVKSPTDHPPCEGVMLLQVDDRRRLWAVRLPEGISKHSERVALARSD